MGWQEDMIIARDNAAARLVEITATPKPSYSIDGQTIQWAAYQRMLQSIIDGVTETLEKQASFSDRTTTGYT